MNKAEIVKSVAEELGMTQKDVALVVEKVLDTVVSGAVDSGEVSLSGFGKFRVIDKPARVARNPKTNEKVEVPAKKVFKFAPAGAVKTALNV